jgi:hypothetical protein
LPRLLAAPAGAESLLLVRVRVGAGYREIPEHEEPLAMVPLTDPELARVASSSRSEERTMA